MYMIRNIVMRLKCMTRYFALFNYFEIFYEDEQTSPTFSNISQSTNNVYAYGIVTLIKFQ